MVLKKSIAAGDSLNETTRRRCDPTCQYRPSHVSHTLVMLLKPNSIKRNKLNREKNFLRV